MSAVLRRESILHLLKTNNAPLSGGELSKQCGVSRQVIVQDIARLRMEGHAILSTTKGYLLQNRHMLTRRFHVQHTDEQIADEFYTIVDLGGTVLDVSIHHDLYGDLQAPLYIASHVQIREFLWSLEHKMASPLKHLTDDVHFHTVEADSEEILDRIEQALDEKQYLIRKQEHFFK